MGSPAVRRFRHTTASLASGLVETRTVRWDVAANDGDWKMTQGARLSPVKGVGASRAKARGRLRAPSGAPAQGRKVRVVGGCCNRGEPKREAADGGAHWCGALDGGEAETENRGGKRRVAVVENKVRLQWCTRPTVGVAAWPCMANAVTGQQRACLSDG
jgi:hypothetical protein